MAFSVTNIIRLKPGRATAANRVLVVYKLYAIDGYSFLAVTAERGFVSTVAYQFCEPSSTNVACSVVFGPDRIGAENQRALVTARNARAASGYIRDLFIALGGDIGPMGVASVLGVEFSYL